MALRFGARDWLLAGLLAMTLAAPSAALANGEIGEHVKEFQKHLDEYAADVRKLASRLDALTERAGQGKDVAGDVEAFVEAWEAVKYHGAVERVATPLYPPIWQAIGGLRQAVKQDKGPEAVRAQADRLTAALHEGLGALKLKARMTESGQAGQAAAGDHGHGHDSGPAAAFDRIREALDSALAKYQDGHAEAAKQQVHDAYFNEFEGLEGGLIEQDAELVSRLEEDFNGGLPNLIDDGAPASEVRAKVEAMKQSLAEAEKLLEQAEGDQSEVF